MIHMIYLYVIEIINQYSKQWMDNTKNYSCNYLSYDDFLILKKQHKHIYIHTVETVYNDTGCSDISGVINLD
jgi:hypothetical protein